MLDPGQAFVATAAVLLAVSAMGLLIWALASPGQLAWLTSISNVLAVDLAAWTASAGMLAWVIRYRKPAADGIPAQASRSPGLPASPWSEIRGGQFGKNNTQGNYFIGDTARGRESGLRQVPAADGEGSPGRTRAFPVRVADAQPWWKGEQQLADKQVQLISATDGDNPLRSVRVENAQELSSAPTRLVQEEVDQASGGTADGSAKEVSKREQDNRVRATHLLHQAERVAGTVFNRIDRVYAICRIIEATAIFDPSRAALLLDEAERIARFLRFFDYEKIEGLLPAVALAAVTVDPDRSERIANTVPDRLTRANTLADIARALAAINPDRAERIASGITTDKTTKAAALRDVAEAVAGTDPDRAARLASDAKRNSTSRLAKDQELSHVAKTVAITDPDSALRIADTIIHSHVKNKALRDVAAAMAALDPDRAERTSNDRASKSEKAHMLHGVAEAVAPAHPDRAERIANSITDAHWRGPALCAVATAVAASDPDRAERIFNSLGSKSVIFIARRQRAWILSTLAVAAAATDPDRAERMADSITSKPAKLAALIGIAKALLTNDAAGDTCAPECSTPSVESRHGNTQILGSGEAHGV